ncbi:HB7 protein [Chlamydia pneumoniae TW-183]|uniref:HB7 protein n=2 Tax=Chlamydia pneumoniae TaxID=83558 RepID=A0ABM5LC40_CHLPN|nr:HB7 protein [Chlamydia pneumoniae TW-183]
MVFSYYCMGLFFFSGAISSCGLLVSLGVGLGLSVLGVLLLLLAGLLLFKIQSMLREVPKAPDLLDLEDASERLRVKASRSLASLPKEISQLESYIRSAANDLNTIKTWPHKDQRLVETVSRKLERLAAAQNYMISELCEISEILEEEEHHLILAQESLEWIGKSLFSTFLDMESFLNLSHLSEVRPYLAVNDPRLLEITEESWEVVSHFINVTSAFKKAQILFKNNEHSRMKKKLESVQELLETFIYKSLKRSYRELGCLSEKMRIIHDNPLFPWVQDQQKYAHAKNEFGEIARCLEEFEKTFFWLDEECAISYMDCWDFLNESIQNKKSRVDRDYISTKKIALKDRARTYAKVLLEENPTTEGKIDLQDAQRAFERQSQEFYTLEHTETKVRLEALQQCFSDLREATNVRQVRFTNSENANDLKESFEKIDKERVRYQKEQRLYWETIDRNEQELREEIGESLRLQNRRKGYRAGYDAGRLKGLLRQWKKNLRDVEAHLEDATMDFEHEVSKSELCSVRARLEVLEEELMDMSPKVADIEELLSYEERCILPIRENLERAYLQYNKCSEILSKAKFFFPEDEQLLVSEANLREVGAQLKQVQGKCQERAQKFAIFEKHIQEQKSLIKEQVRSFDLAGVGFLKSELLSIACNLYIKAVVKESIPVDVPCMQLYYSYYEDNEAVVRNRLLNMTERYQNFKRSLNSIQFNGDVLLRDPVYQPEGHETRLKERELQETTLSCKKLKVAQDRLSELESGLSRR